jgi:peptidoglycan/xylan/chitin deacetylase (PgdA/CDA1 family)
MYLKKTPRFVQSLFPGLVWKMNTPDERVVYLTFDDGPIPEVTPWVLDLLEKYNAKATFFCVGDNVIKHPDIYDLVRKGGHAVGNHTHNHFNGWSTENVTYFRNVRKCAQLVDSQLFRPPYGKLKPKQIEFLQRHYDIIMWDVLSGDFDEDLSIEDCYTNVVSNVGPGSIVVFHDSIKSFDRLEFVLPRVLDWLTAEGYVLRSLDHVKVNRQEPALTATA